MGFARPYARLLKDAISRNPALALAEGAAVLPMEGLQAAGRKRPGPAGARLRAGRGGPGGVYTARELFGAFLRPPGPGGAERLRPCFAREPGCA